MGSDAVTDQPRKKKKTKTYVVNVDDEYKKFERRAERRIERRRYDTSSDESSESDESDSDDDEEPEEKFNFEENWLISTGRICSSAKLTWCCYMCCYPIYFCRLFQRSGEDCYFCLMCCPFALCTLRTNMRAKYRIQGTIVGDYCTIMCCCQSCAMIQMRTEADQRNKPAKAKKGKKKY